MSKGTSPLDKFKNRPQNVPVSGMAELEVIFDDTVQSVRYNKELIQYFKNNLDTLNRAGIKFIWRIAIKEEYPMYKERGIKHFPAIIVPPKKYRYGVKDIIKEIGAYVNQRKQALGNMNTIHNGMADVSEEALYEYQKRAIGRAGEDEEDGGNNFDSNFRKRQSDMIRRRQSAGMSATFEPSSAGGAGGIPAKNDLFADDYHIKIPGERDDNIPMRADPSDALQKLRQRGDNDTRDIDLMQMHLDKMETSGNNMDYF